MLEYKLNTFVESTFCSVYSLCIWDVWTLTFAVFLVAGVYGGQTDSQSKPYTPRRAVMYVPGNDQKKIQKVTSLDLDCAVLDCEDGVAANKKVNFFWFPLENCQDDFWKSHIITSDPFTFIFWNKFFILLFFIN